jgi:hypothetical protein
MEKGSLVPAQSLSRENKSVNCHVCHFNRTMRLATQFDLPPLIPIQSNDERHFQFHCLAKDP